MEKMKMTFYFSLLLSFLVLSCQANPESKESILARVSVPAFPDRNFIVTDYGMSGDSAPDSKPAFDAAIQKCLEAGGGRIVVPPGTYTLNGPIHLRSNQDLHLEKGAILKFSSTPEYYLPVVITSWEGTLLYNYSPFIYACRAENVAITGKGIIDGEASETWSLWQPIQKADQLMSREMNHKGVPVEERIFGGGHFLRPHLIQFFECRNILVEGIKIEDSPFWCIHLLKCRNAILRQLEYDAQNKNNDGIDPEYSEDVLIENITFNNNDDNIAIKAGRDNEGRNTPMPSRNIIIRDCRFKGLHAVVIGSEMSAGVHDVYIENCESNEYVKRGIYLKSNPDRGGEISNIFVKNIKFGEVQDCFMVTNNYHNEGEGHTTNIQNIFLENISCEKANGYGIYVKGLEQKSVHDFSITDFKVAASAEGVYFDYAEKIKLKNVLVGGKPVDWDTEGLKQNPCTKADY